MKKYKILTQAEYNQVDHPVPYSFELAHAHQKLYYIGTAHAYDINHPQYDFIKSKFEKFLSGLHGNILIISETKVYKDYETAEKAVYNSGDAGYAHYLSGKHNVPIAYVEPAKKEELDYLLKSYTKEQVAYYHFAQTVSQFLRSNESNSEDNFEAYANKFLTSYKKHFYWDDFDFSLINMYKIHDSIFNKKFDLKDKELLKKIPWPIKNYSVINMVSRDSGYFRDNYIVGQIEKHWKMRRNLFIIYGSSHAVIQEPAIKSFLS